MHYDADPTYLQLCLYAEREDIGRTFEQAVRRRTATGFGRFQFESDFAQFLDARLDPRVAAEGWEATLQVLVEFGAEIGLSTVRELEPLDGEVGPIRHVWLGR